MLRQLIVLAIASAIAVADHLSTQQHAPEILTDSEASAVIGGGGCFNKLVEVRCSTLNEICPANQTIKVFTVGTKYPDQTPPNACYGCGAGWNGTPILVCLGA